MKNVVGSFAFYVLLTRILTFPLFTRGGTTTIALGLTGTIARDPGAMLVDRLTSSMHCFPLRAASGYLLKGRYDVVCTKGSVVTNSTRAEDFCQFSGGNGFVGGVNQRKRKPRRCTMKLLFFASPSGRGLCIRSFRSVVYCNFGNGFLHHVPTPRLGVNAKTMSNRKSVLCYSGGCFVEGSGPRRLFLVSRGKGGLGV